MGRERALAHGLLPHHPSMLQKACVQLVWLMLASTCLAAAPPANDNFTNRFILSGSPAVSTGSLAGATRQVMEVASCDFTGTIWWSWTAPQTGTAVVQILDITQSNLVSAWMAIYNPSDDNTVFPMVGVFWTNMGCFAFEPISSGVWHTFNAYAGRTYYFQASGVSDTTFKLVVSINPSPILYVQPRDVTVDPGQSALFSVQVAGVRPFQYQWLREGTNLLNATAPMFVLTNVTTLDAGNYSAVVTSPTGSSTSRVARLEVPQSASGPGLSAFSSSSNQFAFAVQGQKGRLYRIETSTNLVNWQQATNFSQMRSSKGLLMTSVIYATNDAAALVVPAKSQRLYVRASHYAPSNEVCNLNLKRLRVAKSIWALENKKTSTDSPTDTDILGLLDLPKSQMLCPQGGFYLLSAGGTPTICTVHSGLLEEPFE
jgi:hypothetical protein